MSLKLEQELFNEFKFGTQKNIRGVLQVLTHIREEYDSLYREYMIEGDDTLRDVIKRISDGATARTRQLEDRTLQLNAARARIQKLEVVELLAQEFVDNSGSNPDIDKWRRAMFAALRPDLASSSIETQIDNRIPVRPGNTNSLVTQKDLDELRRRVSKLESLTAGMRRC